MAQQDIITSSNPFQRFPSELVGAICSLLPNSDIKNLRLTSRYLNDKSRLRLNRLFISPNERNLDVLRAVANHPTFRLGVEEIIWDDATLKPIQSYNGRVHYDSDEDDEDEDEEDGGHDSDEDEERV
ncbi:hypothetical protein FocnCong_v010249 [Fusarium oxysporum f. sp. conglutinans]|nr:hypothetical protein FocnCong_v010249 [Fusarium oxysporum f. sp. conglutinans]